MDPSPLLSTPFCPILPPFSSLYLALSLQREKKRHLHSHRGAVERAMDNDSHGFPSPDQRRGRERERSQSHWVDQKASTVHFLPLRSLVFLCDPLRGKDVGSTSYQPCEPNLGPFLYPSHAWMMDLRFPLR